MLPSSHQAASRLRSTWSQFNVTTVYCWTQRDNRRPDNLNCTLHWSMRKQAGSQISDRMRLHYTIVLGIQMFPLLGFIYGTEQNILMLFGKRQHHLKLCYSFKRIRKVWAKEAFKSYLSPVYSTQSCSKNCCHHWKSFLKKKRRRRCATVAVRQERCLNLVTCLLQPD